MKLYLAGPLFTEAETVQRQIEEDKLRAAFPTLEIFNPINAPFNADKTKLATPETIFDGDYEQLRTSDILVADLSTEDAGTIMELGLAIAGGTKIIIGVNSDMRLLGSKAHEYPSMGINHFVLGGLQKYGYFVTSFDEAITILKELLEK